MIGYVDEGDQAQSVEDVGSFPQPMLLKSWNYSGSFPGPSSVYPFPKRLWWCRLWKIAHTFPHFFPLLKKLWVSSPLTPLQKRIALFCAKKREA